MLYRDGEQRGNAGDFPGNKRRAGGPEYTNRGQSRGCTVQDPGDKAEASTQVNKNSEGSVIKAPVDDSQDVDQQAGAEGVEIDEDFIQSLTQKI